MAQPNFLRRNAVSFVPVTFLCDFLSAVKTALLGHNLSDCKDLLIKLCGQDA